MAEGARAWKRRKPRARRRGDEQRFQSRGSEITRLNFPAVHLRYRLHIQHAARGSKPARAEHSGELDGRWIAAVRERRTDRHPVFEQQSLLAYISEHAD